MMESHQYVSPLLITIVMLCYISGIDLCSINYPFFDVVMLFFNVVMLYLCETDVSFLNDIRLNKASLNLES